MRGPRSVDFVLSTLSVERGSYNQFSLSFFTVCKSNWKPPIFPWSWSFLLKSQKGSPYGSGVFCCRYATWVGILAEQHEATKAWIAIAREIRLPAMLGACATVLTALKTVLPPSSH